MILDAAHRILSHTAVIGLLLAGARVTAEDAMPPWLSLAGSGLMTMPDTATLERGRLNAAFTFDNQDRDPLKLDVLDLSAAWVAVSWVSCDSKSAIVPATNGAAADVPVNPTI